MPALLLCPTPRPAFPFSGARNPILLVVQPQLLVILFRATHFKASPSATAAPRSNQVLSNYVGLNAAGTAAIPNQSSGIDIFNAATSNVIGDAGKGNVISGNLAYGMSLSVTGTSMNTVKANLIGLNATATVGIGNAFSGVALFNGARSNTIGGPGAGNTIAFNGTAGFYAGIHVFDNSDFRKRLQR